MFQEIKENDLYDLNAGSIFTEIGYIVGRVLGGITKAVVTAKYHPAYPCGGECCQIKYKN